MDLQSPIAPPAGSLKGDLDPGPRRGAEIPERGRSSVAQRRGRAGGEERRPEPTGAVEVRVADGVDPPPHEVQVAALQAAIDGEAAQAESDRLLPTDHPTLRRRAPSNALLRGWVQ